MSRDEYIIASARVLMGMGVLGGELSVLRWALLFLI